MNTHTYDIMNSILDIKNSINDIMNSILDIKNSINDIMNSIHDIIITFCLLEFNVSLSQ